MSENVACLFICGVFILINTTYIRIYKCAANTGVDP